MSASLLEPLPVGARRLPNRMVFGSHLTNFGRGNAFTDRHLAYYEARAAGGAGLIVTEALTIHPLDYPYEHVPFGHRDDIIPSLARVGAAVRAANGETTLLAQLNHTGGQCTGRLLRQSPWAPSPVADVASKKMAREMEPEHIEEVVAGFAAAAGRVAEAGLDGVELNAGQHSLLRQFLSPLTNFRGDDHGGSLENRMRLLMAVMAAVREALGPEKILGLKLCADEFAPWGGLTPADAAEIARRVATLGRLDYLSAQVGGPFSVHLTDPGMPIPQDHGAEAAGTVRQALAGALPVFAEGRLATPEAAGAALKAGQADAVVMTRALASDPRLPLKLAGSDQDPIRPHVGAPRYFSVRGDWNRPMGDLANPRAGREALLPEPPENPRPALVIGGGPAGLEAAVTLARQRRPVTLLERGPELGGLARSLAAEVPARREFQTLVDYYLRMVERLGVRVELNREVVDYEDWMEPCESIYLATGAKPRPLSATGEGEIPGVSARALLTGAARAPLPAGGRALVVDGEYGFRMGAAVEWLLERGFVPEVVTDDFFVGRELVESAEFPWFNRVAERGVLFHPRLVFQGVRGGEVICVERFSGQERMLGPAAIIVHALPEEPADELFPVLSARHPGVIRIGDARAPRLMGEAILNAHRSVVLGR